MHIFVISLHQIGGNKNSRTEKKDNKKNNSKLDSGRGGKDEEEMRKR